MLSVRGKGCDLETDPARNRGLWSWWWGGACTAHSMFVGWVRDQKKNVWEGGGLKGSEGMQLWKGQFCVVMTTSCAIRTHSVTITTTQGSCRVSAKQPMWGNLQKRAIERHNEPNYKCEDRNLHITSNRKWRIHETTETTHTQKHKRLSRSGLVYCHIRLVNF